jgi:hypothetical protein
LQTGIKAFLVVSLMAAVVTSLANASVAGAVSPGGRSVSYGGYVPPPPPVCTFNGVVVKLDGSTVLPNVRPGDAVSISCTGLVPGIVVVAEQSPLPRWNPQEDEIDLTHWHWLGADGSGNLEDTFHLPAPFVAGDPTATCPPTPDQLAEGFSHCQLTLVDLNDPYQLSVELDYAVPAPPVCTGIASPPDGRGYWLVTSTGVVHAHGDVSTYGDLALRELNAPVRGIASTPDGKGYWLVAEDGGVFAFGDARFYGAMAGRQLSDPVSGLVPTVDGKGYWMVATDGGVFGFGDARFHGSIGDLDSSPIVGMTLDYHGNGYRLVDDFGGVYPFPLPSQFSYGEPIRPPTRAIVEAPDDNGYWEANLDGGVFSYGDARFHGSMGGRPLNGPIVGMAPDYATGGYWLVGTDGGVFAFDAPFHGAG